MQQNKKAAEWVELCLVLLKEMVILNQVYSSNKQNNSVNVANFISYDTNSI